MPFRFRKSFKIGKGLKLNLSRSGLSTTIGGKGLSLNLGKRGAKLTTGIPGTGISKTTNLTSNIATRDVAENAKPMQVQSGSQKPSFSMPWKLVGISTAIIVFICCACVAISMTMDAMGLLPTATPSQIPTADISITETPLPQQAQPTQTDQEYPRVASTRFELLQEEWAQFLVQHDQLTQDIAIAGDNDFYFKTQSILFTLEARVAEMSSMSGVPTEYEAFHQTINEINQEMILLGQNYNLVLDNQDQSALSAATQSIDKINLLIEKAASQLQSATP